MKRIALLSAVALVVMAAVPAAGSGSALSVDTTSVTHSSNKKVLPLPKLALSVGFKGGVATIAGGYSLKGKPLATALRWSETDLDASGNPLPRNPSAGYELVSANGTWKALSAVSGIARTVRQHVAGANKMQLTVYVSVRATKTHRRASFSRTYGPFNLGGYTAVGTAVPDFTSGYGGLDVAADAVHCEWNRTFTVVSGSPTFRGPPDANCLAAPRVDNKQCVLQGMPPGPPSDIVPPQNRGNGVSDPPAPHTGLTVYGIRVACPNGAYAIPQLWIRFSNWPNGVHTDSCEMPLAGVTSFTLPPQWGGKTTLWATFMSFRSNGTTYYATADMINAPAFEARTSGTLDVCQTFRLPPQNTSNIIG